jgi:hypothetical protein
VSAGAVDAKVAFGDDAVVAVAVVVVHDGQALHEVEPVSLGE